MVPRWRVQAPALVQVAVGVPWFVVSLVVLVLLTTPVSTLVDALDDPGSLPGRLSGLTRVVLAAWILSGGVVLWRPAEAAVARWVSGFCPPTPGELAALEPAWLAVRERAGIPDGRYALWVQRSTEVNATASGGHTIAVTRRALQLPTHQLRAVLAHELGHHLGGHALATGLAHWYSVPARLALRIARRVVGLVLWLYGTVLDITVRVVGAVLPGGGCLLSLALLVVRVLMALLSVAVFLVLACVPAALAWFSRLAELQADRVAARLGYGPALRQVLRETMDDDDRARRRASRMALLLATHPSMRTRVRALDRYRRTPLRHR